ncbi:hypothetical protein [Streptomyces sp. enrichment culture]|uniref:hypothetical protein n=1 Tax=Streptomyces sp. enrichment culture TaxID=1795815 RepID=UPI003F55BBEB
MFGARARRTAIAVAVLMGTAACGGGDGGGAGTEAGPEPLTEAQLVAAALAEGEPAGMHAVSDPVSEDGPIADVYTARPAVCQPLVSLAEGATDHDPVAEVHRVTSDPYAEPGVTVDIQLRSYAAQDAAAIMKSLGRAGRECAGGFTEERAATDAKVLAVETVEAPDLGDEAHAFRIVTQDVKDPGLKLYDYLTVVRSGSTTLSFRADLLGTEDFGGVPAEIVDAQWQKFTKYTA